MTSEISSLIGEAQALDLFRPHSAFEVHCSHCHARLNARGDCDTCGLIGRSADDHQRGAATDPAMGSRLSAAIAKRKAYKPAKAAPREG